MSCNDGWFSRICATFLANRILVCLSEFYYLSLSLLVDLSNL